MKEKKEGKSYVTDATTLDKLQGIAEHLMISAMEEIEGMYLYASYAISLDTQKSFVEWIEETSIEIKITEEAIEEEVLIAKEKK